MSKSENEVGGAPAEGKITPEAIKAAENMVGMHLRHGLADEQPTQPGGCDRGWRNGHARVSGDILRSIAAAFQQVRTPAGQGLAGPASAGQMSE